MLFEYSTSIEERKEEKAMLKILKENEKRMDGHFAVEIFEVEESATIPARHWIKIHRILE